MFSNVFKAHLAIIGTNLIYGVNYTIAKGLMPDYVGPFGLSLSRVIGAIILFWITSIFTKHEKIEKKDFRLLFLGSLFGVIINQLMFLKGLDYSTPINSSIIMTINPILVLIIASITLNEAITMRKLTGILLGASGALLLILFSGGEIDFSSRTFWGNLMMLINASSYGIYIVMMKPMLKKYRPITVMKWVFLFGLPGILPFGFEEFIHIDFANLGFDKWLAYGYVIVATTFLAYLLNIYGLQHLNASVTSIYIYSQPLIAVLVALATGRDSLQMIDLISASFIFVGVYLVSLSPNRTILARSRT